MKQWDGLEKQKKDFEFGGNETKYLNTCSLVDNRT